MEFTKDKNNSTKKKEIHKIHRILLYTLLITMLFFSYSNTRLTFEDLKKIQIREIWTSYGPHIINLEGPLNLMRGYIYKKCGFMYNKRLYAPEIEIIYSLEPEFKGTYKDGQDPCLFKRNILNDNAYKSSNDEEKYSVAYHRTLIWMFPSVDNNTVLINSTNPNSFTTFLRAETVKEDVLHFLAALLLLSEGVEVPIECINDTIVLERKGRKENFFTFDIKKEKVTHPEALQAMEVVKFFKKSGKVVRKEPIIIEEFKQGYFLNTPQFLIQTYAFEFLETVEEVNQFNKAVYDILCDLSLEKEEIQLDSLSRKLNSLLLKKRKIERAQSSMFSRCFVPTDYNRKSMVYLKKLKKIELITTCYKFFPFSDSARLPSSRLVPFYISNPTAFLVSSEFFNVVETHLYTLFCCLLYDPATEKYSLEKMTNASEHLKEFFKKYDKPVEETSMGMLKDWNKVVSDLSCGEINYLHNRNKLDVGLLNFLLVVAKVTGTFETYGEKLIEVRDQLKKLYSSFDDSNFGDLHIKMISESTEYMLTSLCVSDKMRIFCKNLYINQDEEVNTSDKIDICGLIIIKYTNNKDVHSSKTSFITIKLNGYLNNLLSVDTENICKLTYWDEEWLNNIKEELDEKQNKFIKCLLIQCIENISATRMKKDIIFGKNSCLINRIVRYDLKDINAVFLLRKIQDDEYKMFIIGCFLCCAKEKEIELVVESQIMRFTSNIVGSLPLNNKEVRVDFLKVLLWLGHKKSIYPTLKLPGNLLSECELAYGHLKYIRYILYTNSTNVLTESLKKYSDCFCIAQTILKDVGVVVELFDCLFRDNNVYALDFLFSSYFKEPQVSDYIEYVHTAYYIWFILACQRKTKHPTIIQGLYDRIEFDTIESALLKDRYSTNKLFHFYQDNKQNVFNVISQMREQLLQRKGGQSKFEATKNFFS